MTKAVNVVSAAALLLAPLLALPARGADALGCRVFDHGPATSAKPVAVCVGYRDGRPAVRLSKDRGRTWSAEKVAVGTPEPTDTLFSVVVSPKYDTDKTIYLQYQSLGLFASTDAGATFVPVDPQASTEMSDPVRAVDGFGPALPGVPAEPALVIPGSGPGVFYRGQHLPIAGSGHQQERGFYQFGHGDGSVVLNASQGPDETFALRTHLSRCTPELACPGGQTLPAGQRLVTLAVDPARSAKTAVALLEKPFLPSVWASTDQGRTFRRNAAFDKVVAPYAKKNRNSAYGMSVAVLPGGRTWVVQVAAGVDGLLLVTTDAGRTWTRRPFPRFARHLVASSDGRLYGFGLVFECSADAGRSWRLRCP